MLPEEQANEDAYKKLKSNPHWLAKYEGKYVVFVKGEQVCSNITDKQGLLNEIRLKYPNEPKFFEKVIAEEEEEIYDLPALDLFDKLDI